MYRKITRLTRKRRQKIYRKIFLAFFLIVIFFLFSLFYGIPLLIKMSIFISEVNQKKSPIQKEITTYITSPILEPLEKITNKSKITINGSASPGSNIEIFLNGSSVKKTITDKKGNFTTSISLTDGENKILAIAINESGNESKPSEVQYVLLKTKNPKLIIYSPEDNQIFQGEDNKQITITGETNPENTLYLNDRLIIIQTDGSFAHNYELKEGENTLKFLAKDIAGNKSEKEIKVTWKP